MNELPAANSDDKVVALPGLGAIPPRPKLLLCGQNAAGQRFELEPGSVIIGRMPAAQVCVQGQGVSRQHAQMQISSSRLLLRDLGSANGTHVNGQRIKAPVPLRDGDLIRVGSVVLRFQATALA